MMTKSNKNGWGNPTKDHMKNMGIDTPLISIHPDDIIISSPPGRGETKLELQKVMRSVNAADNFNFISNTNFYCEFFYGFLINHYILLCDIYSKEKGRT